ncbi:hypothetical protein EC604_16765 [Paenibacillus amylolyticus]|uniref:Uncharacterized protein n=1 Tax=Paenibacillus amylolyticus TaxID=1451 RepID=A0A5M9WV34_PAEAM|nr:hypothetical protein EC604_16765 [Paenibacillus amylolyticus]
MSEHEAFELEKLAIERLVAQGYRIYSVREHLEGAHVTWVHPELPGENVEQYVGTASGRKWFSHILIRQLQEQRSA